VRDTGSNRHSERRNLSPAEAYCLAAILIALASLSRWALGSFTQNLQAFTTVYPAVLFATLFGGAGPGLFVAVLGGFICWWKFLTPYTSLLPLTTADEIDLLSYFGASLAIVWATDHYRKLIKRLQDEEHFRKLAVDELAHRLKNKIATIQSIISFRLRKQPERRDEIASSLAALAATDDLITAAQGKGALIRGIFSAEIAPYDVSRISMSGPECLLPPKLALTMALLVHELATNAAKYGALSISTGKLSIDWSLSNTRLSVIWRESDGPNVTPPNHNGFGTRLIRQALEQFDGKAEVDFAPTGLVCKLSVVLPALESEDLSDVSASS
jgi:two-component sensor histidine kinase